MDVWSRRDDDDNNDAADDTDAADKWLSSSPLARVDVLRVARIDGMRDAYVCADTGAGKVFDI